MTADCKTLHVVEAEYKLYIKEKRKKEEGNCIRVDVGLAKEVNCEHFMNGPLSLSLMVA